MESMKSGGGRLDVADERWFATGSWPAEDLADTDQPDDRAVVVTDEAIYTWYRKFGQPYANELRRRCLRPGDQWHRDEMR